jgi:hypothetical protein
MREWRSHPGLQGRFHPDFPDDTQVVAHEGGPRTSTKAPELVWVRVTGVTNDVFEGTILNVPTQLNLSQGAAIRFVVPKGGPHPVMVDDQYLRERSSWTVEPCDKCGFTELLDAPSRLVAAVFPGLPAGSSLDAFTAFCGLCGGVQAVQRRDPDMS